MTYIHSNKWFSNIDFLRLYVLKELLDSCHQPYKFFYDTPNSIVPGKHFSELKLKDDDVLAFVRGEKWFIEHNFSKNTSLLFTKIPCYSNTLLFDIEDDDHFTNQVKTLDLLFFCTEEMLEKICKKKKQLSSKTAFCLCDDANKILAEEDAKKNGISWISAWDKFTKFVEQLLNCAFIYTDSTDGVALSIALNKKMKFYFPHNKASVERTNSIFSYLGMQMKGTAAVDNAYIQQRLQDSKAHLDSSIKHIYKSLKKFSCDNVSMMQDSMSVSDYCTTMMETGEFPLCFYNKKTTSKKTYDFTLIQAFFGDESSLLHATAAKNAITYNLRCSNDMPKQWIFIEYGTHQFECLKQFGIEYYHIARNPKSDGLFLKECLWNIAWRKYAKSENLCFLDADVICLDCDWVKKTYNGFKKYDVFQNYSYDIRSEAKSWKNVLKDSSFSRCNSRKYSMDDSSLLYNSDTGLNICVNKQILEKIDGFVSCPLSGADFVYVYLFFGRSSAYFPLYLDHHMKKGYEYNVVFGRQLKFGYCDSLVLHHAHSDDVKEYDVLNMVQCRCGSYYQPIIAENQQGLIEWADTQCANVCKRTTQRIKANSRLYSYANAEKIIQEEVVKEYGAIDDEHPLLFVTCFNPGVNLSTKQVLQTKALLDKYCLDKHDFVCITNESIPGVKCIPISKLDITSADFQMEMWHCNYFDNPNTSVMYIDLDIVPLDYFRLPRCPKDTVWMVDENQMTQSYGTKFNFGCVYFNGDLSFIYDEITANFSRMYKYYNDLQPFVTHLLLSHDIKIQNLYNFVNLAFVDFRFIPSARSMFFPKLDGYKFIHFIGPIKPWNFANKKYKTIVEANAALKKIRDFYNRKHV